MLQLHNSQSVDAAMQQLHSFCRRKSRPCADVSGRRKLWPTLLSENRQISPHWDQMCLIEDACSG